MTFREYYDLVSDPWQLTNLLGDANPDNDPPAGELAALALLLSRDRRCVGTEGEAPCP